MSSVNFARVRTLDHTGTRRTILLNITAEDNRFLRGIEVNRDGLPIVPRDADERLHIIDKAAILTRVALVQDRKYGTLVTEGGIR